MSYGHGGPGWNPGGGQTPDWNALAENQEASRARRRRWLLIGGGAAATAAVAAVVAFAVATEGGGSPSDGPTTALPTPENLPASPDQPDPDFTEAPPPPNPREFITDPERDTAPRSAQTLFPAASVRADGGSFARTGLESTEECASAASNALAAVLNEAGCTELHRATFTRDGVAVTVGIAVLPSQEAATRVKEDAQPYVSPLTGGGVPTDFCRYSACRSSASSLGRYAYFTVAGYLNGTSVTAEEEQALAASRALATYAADRLYARAEEQAEAAATATPAN
ncbi:hypothetical protein [Streptomyces sp. JJ66]|uniref:hypothetical protein n=1 Tax=Streptomyces sp. JJ66 TaxID=2803843 RepID=UPI00214AEB3D|nr:hypothetical protein [Streptomyces sp. JJ66]